MLFDAVPTLLLGFFGTLASGRTATVVIGDARDFDRAAGNPVILGAAHHSVGRDLEDLPQRTREPAKASSPYGTSCREATRLDGNPMRAIIIVAMLTSRA